MNHHRNKISRLRALLRSLPQPLTGSAEIPTFFGELRT
jgi:hypothetical protein